MNQSMYDRKFSLASFMMYLRVAIVIGCLFYAVKCPVSRSQKKFHDLMQLSGRPLNHSLADPTSVKANKLHLEEPSVQ